MRFHDSNFLANRIPAMPFPLTLASHSGNLTYSSTVCNPRDRRLPASVLVSIAVFPVPRSLPCDRAKLELTFSEFTSLFEPLPSMHIWHHSRLSPVPHVSTWLTYTGLYCLATGQTVSSFLPIYPGVLYTLGPPSYHVDQDPCARVCTAAEFG